MNKLLCIVGPTGTGKTALAIKKSLEQPSILVSADSRQVYRGMDIVTGKDHPAGVEIYGLDIVDPGQNCSVSVWYDAVMPRIEEAWGQGKLPIVVGGTGLYVRSLTEGIATMKVPISQSLRDELSALSIAELQDKLKKLDPVKFTSMNHSDQNNPRRLIRAIEVAKSPNVSPLPSTIHDLQSKLIGLKYSDISIQRNKIIERVDLRLQSGAIEETQKLLNIASPQALSALGYRSLVRYLKGELSYDAMRGEWVEDELSYVKRQLTWFNKMAGVEWHESGKTVMI